MLCKGNRAMSLRRESATEPKVRLKKVHEPKRADPNLAEDEVRMSQGPWPCGSV